MPGRPGRRSAAETPVSDKTEGTVEETAGDYELVRLRDGNWIVRCKHCDYPAAGGRKDMVMMWWVDMKGQETPPIHELCKAKVLN